MSKYARMYIFKAYQCFTYLLRNFNSFDTATLVCNGNSLQGLGKQII